MFEAVYSVVLTFDIGGHGVLVRVSVVNGDVPLLLSRPVLGRLGMILDVNENRADFKNLHVKDLQLIITDTGHPAVPVRPIFVEAALAQGDGWDGAEVKILSERAQYTAFAVETVSVHESSVQEQPLRSFSTPSPESSSRELAKVAETSVGHTRSSPKSSTRSSCEERQVFYPKKLGTAVKGMLMADKLSPVPFMTWWNSTSISNDFWIEGEQTLIRVHVIPRKTLFNPGRWNTNSPGHKEALLRLLGNLRTTEAVSCKTHREYHPVHGGWRGTEDDAFLPMLWVGRTVFSRARMSSISSFSQFENPHGIAFGSLADGSDHHQAEDPLGAHEGRAGPGSPGQGIAISPEVVAGGDPPSDPGGQGAEGRNHHGRGATSSAHKDDPRPAEGGCAGSGTGGPRSPEPRLPYEGVAGQRRSGCPDNSQLRSLPWIHVPRDGPELQILGDSRNRSQSWSPGRSPYVRSLVQVGPGGQGDYHYEGDAQWLRGCRGDRDRPLYSGPLRAMGRGGTTHDPVRSTTKGDNTYSTKNQEGRTFERIIDYGNGPGPRPGGVGRDLVLGAPPGTSSRPPRSTTATSLRSEDYDTEEAADPKQGRGVNLVLKYPKEKIRENIINHYPDEKDTADPVRGHGVLVPSKYLGADQNFADHFPTVKDTADPERGHRDNSVLENPEEKTRKNIIDHYPDEKDTADPVRGHGHQSSGKSPGVATHLGVEDEYEASDPERGHRDDSVLESPEEKTRENIIDHYLDEKDTADPVRGHGHLSSGKSPGVAPCLGVEDEYEALCTGVVAVASSIGDGPQEALQTFVYGDQRGSRNDGIACEALARRLLSDRRFASQDLLRLLELLPVKVTKRHRGACGGPTEDVKSFLGGMWTHGGLHGMSQQSRRFPWTVKYVNKAMRELCKDAWDDSPALWTSVLITQNVRTRIHKDVHNLYGSKVLTYSLGDFTGGSLWLEDPGVPGGQRAELYDETGHSYVGVSIDTKEKPFVFDPKRRHATEPWSGNRWCISCFSTRGIAHADQEERDELRGLGFPLRGLDNILTTKPSDYVPANRPAKSVRKGMWKAAKRLVAMTALCTAAAASFTGETLPVSRGQGAVALLEVGGWTKTLDCDFLSAEPILPEDLFRSDLLETLNETVQELAPATIWIHGDTVMGRLRELEGVAIKQIQLGRAVVWDAPHGAAIWDSPVVERTKEAGQLLLETERDGRRELRINSVQPPGPFAGEQVAGLLQTYLASPTRPGTHLQVPHETFAVTGSTGDGVEDRLHQTRGASAISFEDGKKIPAAVQSSLRRLHQNLAHPGREDLVRHLRLAGSAPEVLEAAKRLRCQVCDRHHRGKSARPSSLPTLLEFNQLVAVDAFSVYDAHHTRVEFMMIIDLGTGFCTARELEGHSGEALERVFCDAWAAIFGPPGTLILDLETGLQAGLARFSEWHGTWIRPIAAQAHYQQGSVERCIRTWKQLWEKVTDEKTIEADEAAMAATVINSAMNSLRRNSGTSPAHAVWGREPRLPEDLTLPAEAEHFESVLSRDRLRAREFALRNAARTAYYRCQSDATLRRALLHRTRVAGPELATGDHVFIYRKPKSQKHWEWYGPGVLIGREGPNWWVSYSGRCHLTAPEHLRVASGEELGAAFSLRATQEDLEKILETDFNDETIYVDDLGADQAEGDLDEIQLDAGETPEPPPSLPGGLENKRDNELPRVPPVTKRQRRKGPGEDPGPTGSSPPQHQQAYMAKFAKTARGREKALEKEIPWHLIPPEAKELFKSAEAKQYQEHRDHGALEPIDLEESRRITSAKGDRILPSRFAYRDKNWSKRRNDATIDWKAKARLVIGGHKDPDLLKGLNTHAPTISRQGILLLLQILASNLEHGWTGHAGDVTAAFLSGEVLTRELFLRQPKTGLGNLHPEQLLRIRKPIFGLVDSPAAWWSKLSGTLKAMTVADDEGTKWTIRQCELDNCIFTVHQIYQDENGKVSYGKPQAYLGVHVDDILLIGKDSLCACLKKELSKQFPIDEWETGSFDYVGSFIDIQPDRIKVSQESYVNTRLFTIDVEKGAKDWEPASETQRLDNMSLIGALSWLASQSRPDLQVGVSMSQQCQRDPCIGDIRFTNLLAQRALEHQREGIYIFPVKFEEAMLVCFHDAGWANCPQDQEDPHYALDAREEKDGVIEGGPYGLLSKKAKKTNSSIASQLGCLFVFGNKDILCGNRTKMSILDWKSGACERVCRSTFQAETMACAYGIETSEYILKFLQTLLEGELVKGPTYFPARFVSDCKSLYDHLTREGIPRVPTCKRLAIDLASIRCDLRHFGKIAWTPTEAQLADLLTKPLKAGQWWHEVKSGIKLTFREEEKILNECKSKIELRAASLLPVASL